MHTQLTVVLGLIEREEKILLMRRLDPERPQMHMRWEFPGGKIDPYETPSRALYREIEEETGLKVSSANFLGVYTHHWKMSERIQQTFMLIYHCHVLPGEVILSPKENDAFSWKTPEEVILCNDLLEGGANLFKEFRGHLRKNIRPQL